jgi:hypothetical protein
LRRRIHQVTLLVVMAAMLSMLWPTPAHAQRHVHGHPAVYAHGGYGGPYFYYPGIYYSGFYGWYGYPWAPWGPWGPWPAYGYYDNTSSARIQGAPPEAEVYVDGYYAGTVDDFDGTFQRLRVPPGEHELVIYLEGYKPTRQSILFRPGAGYKINTTLEKLGEGEQAEPRPTPAPDDNKENAPAPQSGRRAPDRGEPAGGPSVAASGFGTLAVRVQPAGASVLIDGERWEGPESGERLNLQLAEGRHRVEVRREGYQPYATDVEVRSGQTASLNVSLPQERR